MSLLYDPNSKESILEYAQRLENSTIEATNKYYNSFAGRDSQELVADKTPPYLVNINDKGKFGNQLQLEYFGIPINNRSEPDFIESGLELKASPLKTLKTTQELRVKERLVLGIIDYTAITKETFFSSHFIDKNKHLLLVFYLYDKYIKSTKLKIKLVDIWNFLDEDKEQIQNDWDFIVDKVKNGLAHELSEGDTLLLGACTKGSTALKSMVKQPYSDELARQRALCFKTNYINYIFSVLTERKTKRVKNEIRLIPKGSHEPIEKVIYNMLNPYFGMSAKKISDLFGFTYNPDYKARYARLVKLIFKQNVKKQRIHEFEAAGIEVKTVRIKRNGSPAEAMSFKAIDFCEIVDEEWEDSDFFQSVVSKFVFVIFVENEQGEYNLFNVKLWNMPLKDYHEAHRIWEDTKIKISNGDYNNFLKSSDSDVAHVRPHGVKGEMKETPQGTLEKPKSFWLNAKYIKSILADLF